MITIKLLLYVHQLVSMLLECLYKRGRVCLNFSLSERDVAMWRGSIVAKNLWLLTFKLIPYITSGEYHTGHQHEGEGVPGMCTQCCTLHLPGAPPQLLPLALPMNNFWYHMEGCPGSCEVA